MAGSQDDVPGPQLVAEESDLLGFDEPVPFAAPALPTVPDPPVAFTYLITVTALRDQFAGLGQRQPGDSVARRSEQTGVNDRL